MSTGTGEVSGVDASSTERTRLPIIGIGASAGGIEAFRGFFENMPPDSFCAFVVVLHLPADRKSILPDILGRWTGMQIVEVTDGCGLQPNCVYIPPPGVTVTLKDDRLHLHPLGPNEAREPSPISMFFDSLAVALREDAIGIVLSGTGNDGSLGLKAIKANGGLTLAQGTDGTAPLHPGMPASAIATGAVDIVAAVEAMPGHIIAIQESRRNGSSTVNVSPEQIEKARLAICSVLHRLVGHDFSGYKDKTFLRRVQRRMAVLNVASLHAYIERLENDLDEAGLLFRDLLIGVTSFFRDQDTFDALKLTVFPRLFEGRGAESVVRVWVPGCATGEEAYSLAILLREFMDGLPGGMPKVHVFATDIDEPAIGTARGGRYPSSLLQGMSPQRKARFFSQASDGSYAVSKEIRDLCTFSAHSLTRDPPFSRIHLVSCRNLLIYLDADLQSMVIPAFHYSLVAGGILLLGSSENISRHENLFAALDRQHRIFQRIDVPSPPLQLSSNFNKQEPQPARASVALRDGAARPGNSRLTTRATARVLERFGPAFVIVSAEGNVIQYSSRIGRFLEPAAGSPNANVLVMARRGLATPLRAALRQAAETGRSVEKAVPAIHLPGEGTQRITLAVEPIHEPGSQQLYLIAFILSEPHPSAAGDSADAGLHEPGTDRQVEAELRDTREQLQSVTEEHETALEELRSTNEELLSVNEELQSTNEELETSKEEIQSINEELQTVNSQLATKVEELDERNTDLQNLFESTHVATVFLDRHLVIRSFTPAVASIYNLIPSDIGRPLTDIMSTLKYADLREDTRLVLNSLVPLERRVTRDDGSTHYLMRILPYRSPNSTVEGTVVTFVDVTTMVKAEQHQRLLVDELNHRVKNMLTVVVSMANQTIRNASNLAEFSQNYMGRIQALTAAYSLLSAESWQSVSLRDLLVEELNPFLESSRTNVVLDGPRVLLEPRAALALSMALHELTTNAVKYGSLSVPEGNLHVKWGVKRDSGTSELVLEWLENDGPPVVPPARRGFGTMLIERGLTQDMSAQVELAFPQTGVRATVRAPLRTDMPDETTDDQHHGADA